MSALSANRQLSTVNGYPSTKLVLRIPRTGFNFFQLQGMPFTVCYHKEDDLVVIQVTE